MPLYPPLQSGKERDTIADVGTLSDAEREVILAMRHRQLNHALPLIVIQWVGNAWKIYEAKLTTYSR